MAYTVNRLAYVSFGASTTLILKSGRSYPSPSTRKRPSTRTRLGSLGSSSFPLLPDEYRTFKSPRPP